MSYDSGNYTLAQIETALAANKLEIRVSSDRWWKARRNGKTKRWVRTPDRYEIPCKVGFRNHFTISNTYDPYLVRIVD